jgi:hypothetical protein
MHEELGQRRRAQRFEVHDVSGNLLFRVNVTVLNLSVNGMAVETTQQLKPGKLYSVKVGGEDTVVDVEGTVKWCHLTKTRRSDGGEFVSVYNAGLAFEGTMTEKTSRLLEFMQEHVVLALEKRIEGSFKLKAGSPIQIATRYDFEILKLSLTGMLVKTHLIPEMNSAFEMELRLGKDPIEVAGRIAYVERVGGTEADPEVKLGVEFLELDEARKNVFRDFIAHELT